MAEVGYALSVLREEMSIADEVQSALNRCQSGTIIDVNARSVLKEALALLREKEYSLSEIGDTLTKHQALHAEVESLRQEVRTSEKRVQDCAKRLTKAEAVLRGPLKDAKLLLEAGRKAEEAEINVSDVVDYAQRISGITSAPSYWKPGMAMVGFAPPAPRPEMMRAGALSAFAVTTGTSLRTEDLFKIAQDLDKPPDQTSGLDGKGTKEGTSGSEDGSSETSHVGEDKSVRDGEGSPSRGGNTSAKRVAGGTKEKSSSGKLARAASASFARPPAPKRPQISLDLDDLDSDSEEEEDSD